MSLAAGEIMKECVDEDITESREKGDIHNSDLVCPSELR